MNYEMALSVGGKDWTGGTNHRVYFNQEALITLYGLEGIKIVNGRPRKWNRLGEKISNNKVFSLLSQNAYYDVNTEKMVGIDPEYVVK